MFKYEEATHDFSHLNLFCSEALFYTRTKSRANQSPYTKQTEEDKSLISYTKTNLMYKIKYTYGLTI